jgi:hypothetical protein
MNFATTHTFMFKLYMVFFFLLSREKVWIGEPSFFLFRFELLIVRFKSFLTYLCIATFLLSTPTLVTLWNEVIMLLGFYKSLFQKKWDKKWST